MERELLKSTGIELAPSARENSYIQRFYLYQNLTKPREHLLSFLVPWQQRREGNAPFVSRVCDPAAVSGIAGM